jgi:hypothetical protein
MMAPDTASNFLPVVVVGAARSGTKILRDALCSLPDAGTWPCDEINNIWRHGNTLIAHDEFGRQHARPRVRHYVRRQFEKRAASGPYPFVVEKTCANSLRVGFVDEVLPTAKFIHLVRDGRDAAASALRWWRGDYSLGKNRSYIAAKLRHVPPTDLPLYAARLTRNMAHRRMSREQRAAHWGPRLQDLEGLLLKHPLEEVCALQWQRCVDRAGEDLEELSSYRVFQVRYEDFVAQPAAYLEKMANFLGSPVDDELAAKATADVSGSQVGQGRCALGPEERARVESLVRPTLARYGYV